MKKIILSVSVSLIALNSFAFGLDPLHPRVNLLQSRLPIGLTLRLDDQEVEEGTGKALSFGYYEFSSQLNPYLAANSSVHTDFMNNYMAVGLDDITNATGHWFDVIGSIQYILPQKVTAGLNDSLQLRLRGWNYTMSIIGFDAIPGRTVAIVLATQITMGNLKMDRMVAGQKTKYTNPFVAPGGRVEFRLTFGQFMIGGRATYRYDITHELWKRKNDNMPVLPEYSNDGLAYFGYIGWIFENTMIDRPRGGGDIGGRTNGGEWR